MRKFKKAMRQFLKENRFLPISQWNSFEITHGKPKKLRDEENEIIKIKINVKNKSGVYLYKKNNKILYIGKGKLLFSRLKDHYNESILGKKPKHKKAIPWHIFFSNKRNIGKVKIFWKEIKKERERQILEKMLECVLGSDFEKFRKINYENCTSNSLYLIRPKRPF